MESCAPSLVLEYYAAALAAFTEECANWSGVGADSSPIRALFVRVGAHDPSLVEISLHADAEFMRWPIERQRAAIGLLRHSPCVLKVNLSGLMLKDDLSDALASMVAPGAAGRIEVLNLEQNDLREAGLLAVAVGGSKIAQWDEWEAQAECKNVTCCDSLDCTQAPASSPDPYRPIAHGDCPGNAGLYNGLIAPLVNTTIAGWLWFLLL